MRSLDTATTQHSLAQFSDETRPRRGVSRRGIISLLARLDHGAWASASSTACSAPRSPADDDLCSPFAAPSRSAFSSTTPVWHLYACERSRSCLLTRQAGKYNNNVRHTLHVLLGGRWHCQRQGNIWLDEKEIRLEDVRLTNWQDWIESVGRYMRRNLKNKRLRSLTSCAGMTSRTFCPQKLQYFLSFKYI